MSKQHPPQWLEETQCMGKHRFDDAGLARKVASQSSKRKSGKINAYRCTHCGGWHVGNAAPKKLRK